MSGYLDSRSADRFSGSNHTMQIQTCLPLSKVLHLTVHPIDQLSTTGVLHWYQLVVIEEWRSTIATLQNTILEFGSIAKKVKENTKSKNKNKTNKQKQTKKQTTIHSTFNASSRNKFIYQRYCFMPISM